MINILGIIANKKLPKKSTNIETFAIICCPVLRPGRR